MPLLSNFDKMGKKAKSKKVSVDTVLFTIFGLGMAGLGIYYISEKRKENNPQLPTNTTNNNSNITTPVKPSFGNGTPIGTLCKGAKSDEVKMLQLFLLNKGQKLPKYGADGGWGDETQTAVNAIFGNKTCLNYADLKPVRQFLGIE